MLPLLGGTDGFPVTLWLNGAFAGLYLLSPRLDGDLFGMYRDEDAAILVPDGDGADTRFRANASAAEASGWSVVWTGSGGGLPAGNRLNQLIRYVMESDGAMFYHTAAAYLDVDTAIDMMILTYALGLTGGEPVLLSYGELWVPALCGTENTFGADEDGVSFRDASENLPKRTKDGWQSGLDHLLFERLFNVFEERVIARYWALRQTVLTEDHILSVLDGQMGRIPAAAYAMNAQLRPGRSSETEERARIAAYLRKRLPLLDAAFGGY